jgi:hypothetical protein
MQGYTMGTQQVARSPIALSDFEAMKASALFGAADIDALRMSLDVVKDQVEDILDVWYGFVGSQPHLLASFSGKSDGKPLADYLGGVRRRFGQWILDTARAEYDQAWLDYQHEIGLRHHRLKKNQTDGAPSTDLVPFRNLFALIKSCLLQLTLWSHPYVKAGDF